MKNRPFSATVCAASVLTAVCNLSQPTLADVTLPHVFGAHMVLQQQKPVPVWGWANPGESVAVQIGKVERKAVANGGGEWRTELPAMQAGGPLTLTVRAANTLTLEDVMVGEVWLCSGQSNMEMGVTQAINGAQEVAAAKHPGIRLFLVPKVVASSPLRDVQAEWRVCSPETIAASGWGGFSATGYYFGRELNDKLQVPVGLIQSAWGGTMIEPWTPPEAFGAEPELKGVDERVKLANPTSTLHKERLGNYLAANEKWQEAARKAMGESRVVSPTPEFPRELVFKCDAGMPTAIYNGMIRPLAPFAIRGAIWYQGESNHFDGAVYTTKMKALVGGWRKVWGDADFPFFFTQIAPFRYGDEDAGIIPRFWQAQAAAASVIANTGMAGTMDIGDVGDIHPKNKQEVGRRLALLALANTYGKRDIVSSGPVFKSMKIEGGKLRLSFSNADGGLASRDGKPLSWFEVVDADTGGFVKAEAVIEGSTVVVSAASVPHPVALRFGWNKVAEPNLCNAEKLPALPFRTGDVPLRDGLAHVAEAKSFKLVYDLDLARLGPQPAYSVDNHTSVKGPIDRIAYCVELLNAKGEQQFLYVSMDAFTQDLAKIGVPTQASGAFFQQNVSALNVESNVKGIVTGSGIAGGNIEFWPFNYAPDNGGKVPNASPSVYDFGDMPDRGGDYGSMQVHNHDARQTLFALNHWIAGTHADLGIGNDPTGNAPDWTFAANADSYQSKRLRVLVHVKE